VDFVRRWSEKTEIGAGRFIGWLDITASKFYDWRDRYGKVNEHNGLPSSTATLSVTGLVAAISSLPSPFNPQPRWHKDVSRPRREGAARRRRKQRLGVCHCRQCQ
jgi:hypothetical protein